ncbi:CG14448 [Drosophila busckii]|uniref:CG14448 n=2 Tax=Drosophila busckii TaxID=30019 RepID=A0A0M4EQI8_DROBS|nr:CG14448 [Drosophila busckii]
MEAICEQLYGKQVLVGNWLDRRYCYDSKNNGIVPGLNAKEGCEQHLTLSQDTYTDAGYKGDDCKQYFIEKRVTRMRNFLQSNRSKVKLIDAPELRNNYTTTNTVAYELLPTLRHEFCLAQTAAAATKQSSAMPERQLQVDMLQCFGNTTKTYDYAKNIRKQAIMDNIKRMQTTYAYEFNRKHPKATERSNTEEPVEPSMELEKC